MEMQFFKCLELVPDFECHAFFDLRQVKCKNIVKSNFRSNTESHVIGLTWVAIMWNRCTDLRTNAEIRYEMNSFSWTTVGRSIVTVLCFCQHMHCIKQHTHVSDK